MEVAREPVCTNKHDDAGCDGWVKGGECTKNPGFMKSGCMKACGACPPAIFEGKQATALVRNAWEEEDEGMFTALYTARHVESHEARVVVVRFGERAKLEAMHAAHATATPKAEAGARVGRAASEADATSVHAVLVGGHAAHAVHDMLHEPPTLSMCAEEHSDSMMLAGIGLVFIGFVLLLCMSRLVKSEVGRSAAWHTPAARGKDRSHDV